MLGNWSSWALFAPVLAVGALLPVQALVNARLGNFLGTALWASAFQNMVGVLSVGVLIAVLRAPPPLPDRIAAAPAWSWAGGAMGMLYVTISLFAAPRLGATATMAGMIAGQLLCALLLDHFGVLHERRPVDLQMLGGIALLAAGILLLIQRS